jgi:hypothetical protein
MTKRSEKLSSPGRMVQVAIDDEERGRPPDRNGFGGPVNWPGGGRPAGRKVNHSVGINRSAGISRSAGDPFAARHTPGCPAAGYGC